MKISYRFYLWFFSDGYKDEKINVHKGGGKREVIRRVHQTRGRKQWAVKYQNSKERLEQKRNNNKFMFNREDIIIKKNIPDKWLWD